LVTTPGFLNAYFSNNNNDSLTTINQINWVNIFVPSGVVPDCRLDSTSVVATGADFTNDKFGDLTNSVTETIKTSFKVFPNPTDEDLNITFSSPISQQATLTVRDIAGKLLQQNTVNAASGSNLVMLGMDSLAAGTYFVTVNLGENQKTLQVTVK
jgi:hypothetical protein